MCDVALSGNLSECLESSWEPARACLRKTRQQSSVDTILAAPRQQGNCVLLAQQRRSQETRKLARMIPSRKRHGKSEDKVCSDLQNKVSAGVTDYSYTVGNREMSQSERPIPMISYLARLTSCHGIVLERPSTTQSASQHGTRPIRASPSTQSWWISPKNT